MFKCPMPDINIEIWLCVIKVTIRLKIFYC